jgi:hypothetical protein
VKVGDGGGGVGVLVNVGVKLGVLPETDKLKACRKYKLWGTWAGVAQSPSLPQASVPSIWAPLVVTGCSHMASGSVTTVGLPQPVLLL